jgi:hypothetical protein
MPPNQVEILRRQEVALAAIKAAFGSEDEENDVALFVSHHLEEVEGSYWQQHLGAAQPEPSRVLDILKLQSHWSAEDEDGIDAFDFTLPSDVTDYVISVRFDDAGQVEDISMES